MYQVPPYDLERRNGAAINGSNGTNGNHLIPAPPVLMPLPGPAVRKAKADWISTRFGVAFRRRWFLALSLGVLFGIPAAIGVWFIAPAPYVAFAEVRLNSMAEGFPGSNTRPVQDFDIRKQAVLKRATHPMLLNEALRPPEVRNASLIREQEPHVTTWLEETLSLKPVGMEYIRIELEGEHPHELALIVNSVADALVADVDHDMTEDLTNRKSQLDKLIAEVKTSLSSKNTELENMRNTLKIDPNEIERRQSYLIELTASLRAALVTIELEKLKLQGQKLSLPENAQAPKTELNELVDKVAVNDPRYQRAAEDVISHRKQIETQEKYIVNLTEGLSETHPKIVAAKAKLETLKTQLTGLEKKEASVREEIRKEVHGLLTERPSTSHRPCSVVRECEEGV